MSKHPYSDLPKSAFWKTGVAQQNLDINDNIYKKKFNILPKAKIATAGSCFAQHITQNLKTNGFYVFDVEPPPPGSSGISAWKIWLFNLFCQVWKYLYSAPIVTACYGGEW